MLGSRVCWQLLLGWALLLGQPVFGDSDVTEQPSLEEPEKPVLEELEEPVPEEPEKTGSEESEEPVPEETEEPVPEGESVPVSGESMERKLTPEEREMLYNPPDEELEKMAKDYRRWLKMARDNPHTGEIHVLTRMALHHHNQKSDYIYRSYDRNIKIKKAVGTMVYIKLLLVKTNCTKEEGLHRDIADYYNDVMDSTRRVCEVPPESEQEILECTFTLFHDARGRFSHYEVTDHSCKPFNQPKEGY